MGRIITDLDIPAVDFCFTSGCFDLLHSGHIWLFKQCREIAHGHQCKVFVGVNSDKSMWDFKKKKPIFNQWDRRVIVAAIQFVDYVFLFDQRNPTELIRRLKPKVIVHGDNAWQPAFEDTDELEGYVGEVIKIPTEGGWSSSKVTEEIMRRYNAQNK